MWGRRGNIEERGGEKRGTEGRGREGKGDKGGEGWTARGGQGKGEGKKGEGEEEKEMEAKGVPVPHFLIHNLSTDYTDYSQSSAWMLVATLRRPSGLSTRVM